ncbi:dep domain-containing protein 1a [Biomphalaria glabrata]|nr:DEP domain-containing protein 1A [Biomphalaria glabrata]KAI8774264.1 DEP domain-containing protein 1A [Biomphalaria glabrata]
MELTRNTQDSAYCGPYKATRLWNDVIFAFRQYVPCGKHRRYMKTFDNCFSGTSAAEWLLHYLKNNNNFNEEVSRQKALSLLNKLYKAGIFEEVKVTKSMRHKQDVQENRLYRFLPASPSKMKIYRLPLAPRNDSGINRPPLKDHSINKPEKPLYHKDKDAPFQAKEVACTVEQKPISKLSRKISILKKEKGVKEEEKNKQDTEKESYPPCHLVTRILTTREIKDTWKTIFIHRLKKTLSVRQLTGIITEEEIDGYNIMHNCIYLNKSGIVTNLDAKDHLPQWVMSAMKCLARWPEPPEPGLPNYPGFEKDVFGVVKDYFLGLDEPLIPYIYYDVFINVFVMAGNSQPRHSSPHHTGQGEASMGSSLWTSASLENIILNFTRKYCLLDNTDHTFGTNEDLQSVGLSRQHFGTQEDLRFVSHMDKSYLSYNNRKVFPSTDGMDKIREGHKSTDHFPNVDIFPTMTSFKSCHALSKTTHSAGEAWPVSHLDRSTIRKYGSTPNLKVSRYETAFGPDNRTVTRIFYQNGMTTDYGHDEEDDLYQLPLDRTGNKEKQTSADLERSPGSSQVNQIQSPPHKFLPRSKSQYDVTNQSCDMTENKSLLNIKHNTSYTSVNRHSSFISHNESISKKKSLSHQNLNDMELCEKDMSHSVSSSPASGSLGPNKSLTQISRTPSLVKAYGPGYRPVKSSEEEGTSLLRRNRTQRQRPVSLTEAEKGSSLAVTTENLPEIENGEASLPRPYSDTVSTHLLSPKSHAVTPDLHLSYITPFFSTNKVQSCENNFLNFPRNGLFEERAKNSLQMVSLLLPPANRRKLHLLFKMMTKMNSNPNLFLDYTQTTRSLLLSTFYKGIIHSQEDSELDNVVVLQLVSFMLDFYDDIFTPPSEIKAQVSNRLKIMQRPQVVYSPRPDRTVRFCQQTTVTDYENQRISTSQSALAQLLEGIVANDHLDTKTKKKHLKQFQRTYPTIYAQRFPTPESEAAVVTSKPKERKPSKSGPLNRLKGLRL